jgi:Tfp pilus assembly protein PilO
VTRTNKILLSVVALALAGAAFYFLVLGPKRDEVAKLDGDIAAKQAEIATAQQTLATYEQARKSYKANYTTLARLGKAVPADDDVRSLLIQLAASSKGTGVDFQKIELGSGLAGDNSSGAAADAKSTTASGQLAPAPGSVSVAGGALSAMPFNFTFTGGFFDLNTFFSKLEHYVTVNNAKLSATGRLLRLESIAITPSVSGFPDMQAAIGAATYIVPPVEGVPGAPVPSTAQNASTTPSTPSSPSAPSTTTANAGAAQ